MSKKAKVSLEIAKELEEFLGYIQSWDKHIIRSYLANKVRQSNQEKSDLTIWQEHILTTLALILNPKFRERINSWREEYNFSEFDTSSSDYIDWAKHQNPSPPYKNTDAKIYDLCADCRVDFKKYGTFIINYLYYGFVTPSGKSRIPFNLNPYFAPKEEYRYKSRIELDYGIGKPDGYKSKLHKANIRIFGNTSQKNLINFIKVNWSYIVKLQKELEPYPHISKYDNIKREVQVYIFYLLGETATGNADRLSKENIPGNLPPEITEELEKEYNLYEDNINKIVKKIKLHINLLTK